MRNPHRSESPQQTKYAAHIFKAADHTSRTTSLSVHEETDTTPMCRSTRQRSTAAIDDLITHEQETSTTSLVNSASEERMMILHPTNTTTTTFSPRRSAASPTLRTTTSLTDDEDDDRPTNYATDHNHGEQGNDFLKEEGMSSMMIPLVVSPTTSIDANRVIIILPHDEIDGEDERRMETRTTTGNNARNKNDNEAFLPAIAVRGDPHILLAQKEPVQSKNNHDTAYTTTTTTKKKKDKKKRRVSIDERVHVRTTLMRSEISPEEKSAAWYSTEEYKEITESCCKQVQRLNRGEVLKDKKYCARGLEAYTRIRAKTRKLTRLLAYEALWEEEERQLMSGIRNDEALARVYRAVSSSCELWARRVALEDQKEADNIAHF